MILLDCGNHQVKAQHWKDGALQGTFATRYRDGGLARLERWLQGVEADHCYLSSVLDSERQGELDTCLETRFGRNVTRFRATGEALGVKSAYDEPERLGVDRWLALLGAAATVDGDCIVIDAGSAITLDLLRGTGQHLGGAILPGTNTTPDDFRRIFKHIDFADPRIGETGEPGGSTEAAIRIDYAQTPIEEVANLVQSWREYLSEDASILLAGGDAESVQRALDRPSRIVPDLVFRGMRRLAVQ